MSLENKYKVNNYTLIIETKVILFGHVKEVKEYIIIISDIDTRT